MRMEIYRLFHNRKLLYVLFGLLILNVGLFLYQNSENDAENIQQIVEEQEIHRNTYAGYVSEVIDDANHIVDSPLFVSETNKFAKQNASNIAKAYERVTDVEVKAGNDIPVITFLDFSPMIHISLIMLILVAFDAVRDQRKGTDFPIYTSSKGRCVLGVRRWAYIEIMSSVIVAINMLIVLFLATYKYGGEIVWDRSIQSIARFRDFTYPISIVGFLFRYYLLIVLAISLVGILVWTCMSWFSNMMVPIVILSGIFLLEYHWKINIAAQSNWNLLKYVNMIEFLDVEKYLFKYYDINIGGNAVNLLSVIKIGLLVLVIMVSLFGVYAFIRRTATNRIKCKINLLEKVHVLQEHYSLVLTELHKVLIFNKGILVIAITIVIALGIVNQRNIVYTEEEQYVNVFYENYSGEITSEVYEFVENEHAYISGAYERYAQAYEGYRDDQVDEIEFIRAQAELRLAQIAEQGLVKIEAELVRAEELETERGIRIHLLNNFGYNKLFGNDGKNTQKGIMINCLFAFIILFSGSFKFEGSSQSTYLLRASCRGRNELMHVKEITAIITGLFVFGILNILHIYYVEMQYGMSNIMAPVQSVGILQNFPFELSILGYLIGALFVRLILYLLIAQSILHLSLLVDQKYIIMILSIIIILPILLEVSVISCFDLLTLNGVLTGQYSWILVAIKGCIIIVAAMIARKEAYKKWCG